MNQDDMKRAVARAALDEIVPGAILGVGTGSTVNHFIDLLAERRDDIPAAVSSSEASTQRLKSVGIRVIDLNDADHIPVYVDGADEVTREGFMIKGGGGALTREKIVAAASDRFVCVVDASKLVDMLGAFPLPIEVIPMAEGLVRRRIVALWPAAECSRRDGFVTDNGNIILDITGLRLTQPQQAEQVLNQIPGVVCVGVFANVPAHLLIIGSASGVERHTLTVAA